MEARVLILSVSVVFCIAFALEASVAFARVAFARVAFARVAFARGVSGVSGVSRVC